MAYDTTKMCASLLSRYNDLWEVHETSGRKNSRVRRTSRIDRERAVRLPSSYVCVAPGDNLRLPRVKFRGRYIVLLQTEFAESLGRKRLYSTTWTGWHASADRRAGKLGYYLGQD